MGKKQKRNLAVILSMVLAIGSLAVQPVHTQAATKKATSIKLNATSTGVRNKKINFFLQQLFSVFLSIIHIFKIFPTVIHIQQAWFANF